MEEGPLPTRAQVKAAEFSQWYPLFSSLPENSLRRKNVTLRSQSICLPPSFKEYLLSDGVRLPIGAKTSGILDFGGSDTSDWSEDGSQAGDGDTDDGLSKEEDIDFSGLCREIQQAIDNLGGEVVPKLNWSSPRDAVWVNGNSLKCKAPGDVFLLLKSSDFCSHDLQYAMKEVSDPNENDTVELELVLRKWCNFFPSQEFRCFVRDGELIAVSQRHHSQSFQHLVRDQYLFRSLVIEFFDEIVKPNYATSNYVFDVYIDKKERVWLVDFNVWGRRTDALLYTWAELSGADSDIVEIRVVQSEKEVRADPLSSYRAPIDTLYMTSLTGGDSAKFDEFMGLCEKPRDEDE